MKTIKEAAKLYIKMYIKSNRIMSEQEIALLFKQYNNYLDSLLGLIEPHNIEIELLKFRHNLRNEAGDWSNENVFYLIEAKTFLKYLELCQKEY